MKNSLAIYDLGVGGLSLIEPIRNYLPELSISYYCDVEFFVYDSTTGFSQIQERCKKACRTIFEMKSNLVLLAAHTLTLSSLRELQTRWINTEYPSQGKNVIGLYLPIKEELFDPYWHLRDEVGIFLMSHSAIRTGYYQQECLKHGFNNAIFVPADKLNTAIEFGDDAAIDQALIEVLAPFSNILSLVKYVVPTSTHFDFLQHRLEPLFNPNTTILSPNTGMAHNIVNYINKHPEYKVDSDKVNYYTTGNIEDFKQKIFKYTGVEASPSRIKIS
jgi:glutamate racemase